MMNLRLMKFIDLYVETGNAKQSYRSAGYIGSEKSMESNGCRMIGNEQVKAAIAKRREELLSSGMIRLETKRKLLWDIALKASGHKESDDSEHRDYKSAVTAINELNRMDGHHQSKINQVKPARFTFDQEMTSPDESEIGFMNSDPKIIQQQSLTKNDI